MRFLPFLLAGLFLTPAPVLAQIDWVDADTNPVIDTAFDPDSRSIWRPSVVFDGETYHMWYGKDNGDGVETMGYATSPDGLAWTLVSPTVLAPSTDPNRFDADDASQGWVIADGDTLKMWYWGNGPNIGNIGYAVSFDGINWVKQDGPGTGGSVYDRTMDGGTGLALATPTVVKKDGTYHMWYARVVGANQVFLSQIGYATSTDGINWTNVPGPGINGAVLDVGEAGQFDTLTVQWPAVVATEEGFMMWYMGASGPRTGGLGCATSPDGINWIRLPGNGTNGACFDGVHLASVIKQGEQYIMWYGIFGSGNSDEIHYAISGMSTGTATEGVPEYDGFILHPNHPNPFRETTTITFTLKRPAQVRMDVYDLLGRLKSTLADQPYPAGTHSLTLHATDWLSGVYVGQLRIPDQLATRLIHLSR